jgi:Amt family ammonium transporter
MKKKKITASRLLISYGLAAAVAPVAAASGDVSHADNGFMMICTALVLFMTVPGIALFYGGLLRSKNVLSMLTQVLAGFALVCVLWVIYGYSLAFGEGNAFYGSLDNLFLKGITVTSVSGSIYQMIHVAFQASFACITIGLIVGAFAERVKFAAVIVFIFIWFPLAYVPMAHMVWGGGLIDELGAIDFAGGTVVHINAAVAGLVGAYFVGKRSGLGRESFKPHNLPLVFIGACVLYIGWFGFNAGSAGEANEIAGLAFINTVVATAAAILSWLCAEWLLRGKPSLLGACSGCIAGLVTITPAAGSVGVGGALFAGFIGGLAGLWGVVILRKWLAPVDDSCDVFGLHGVCGIVGCLLTGVLSADVFGGIGIEKSIAGQVWAQLISVIICLLWSGAAALIASKTAAILVGLRVSEQHEREGLDINSHGENAYNR